MARLLMKALRRARFEPHLVSELRTLDKTGSPGTQQELKAQSEADASRIIAQFQAIPESERPRLWVTYHVYYKAPDWIGPIVSEALRIPYVIAEGSRSSKRAGGPWDLGHRGSEAALDRADAVLVMTSWDRVALEAAKPEHQALVDFPPFLDLEEWTVPERKPQPQGSINLLTVAMMREGDKLASYRILAQALAALEKPGWTLDIVGDGEARGEVEKLFESFGSQVRFHGRIDSREALGRLYAQSDLFVWPAVNEAYGMVLLEAQAFGCAVVAGAYGGVTSVVQNGQTGLLTSPGDAVAFAQAISGLIADRNRLDALGTTAAEFIAGDRGIDKAAQRLTLALMPLLAGRA